MQASEFATHIHSVKRSGGEFTGKCPAHEDQRNSLSFRDGDKGLVVTCFAGCTVKDITAALGIPMKDLFADGSQPRQPQIIKTYDYCDETGVLLYQVVRMIPKDFRQRKPDGQGWTWKLNGVRRVPYRLKDLQGKPEVMIVEGEKDADRLWGLGVPATTNAGGAGKWVDDYSVALVAAGVKGVVILPDNDPPGEAHGRAVAESCRAVGLHVKLVQLPGLPPKGDVSDWLGAGKPVDDLRCVIDGTPVVEDRDRIIPIAEAVRTFVESLERDTPDFIPTPFPNLNKLLCGGMVPGELFYLAAKGGVGKSALALELARYVSRNTPVLVVSQEMGIAALVRRFIAQEGGVSATKLRQHNLDQTDWAKITKAAGSLSDRHIGLVEHAPTVEKIKAKVRHMPGVKLVVVDYLQLIKADGRDSRAQLEAASAGLMALAKQEKIVVFCLSAVSARGEGNHKPSLSWLRGSGMLEHDPHVVLLMHQPDEHDPARELIIAKARDAQCGNVMLHFSPDIVHFVEMETQREPTDRWERT